MAWRFSVVRFRSSLAAEIDEVDFCHGLAEKAGAESLELLNGVGGIEAAGRVCGGIEFGKAFGNQACCGACRSICRVDDGEGMANGRECAVDGRFDEGIVGAAKKKGLGRWSGGEGFGQIDSEDLLGNGVVSPAFFYERNQKRAGLFIRLHANSSERMRVRMRLDGGRGRQDQDMARCRCGRGERGLGTGFDDANHRDWQ